MTTSLFNIFLVVSGLIYGAAIGDALSFATEGLTEDECHFHYDPLTLSYDDIIKDSYRSHWKKGDWGVCFDQMVNIWFTEVAAITFQYTMWNQRS